MSEWIKCSERMPDKRKEALVISSTYGIRIAFYDEKRKCWDDGDFFDCITGVSHWMPLPEPPEGD